MPKKDILLHKGMGMLRLTGMHRQTVYAPYCNAETNERGLRLLEFATCNNLVLTNTLGPNKPPSRWTWHSQDMKHHYQTGDILVRDRFHSGINVHRTGSFPGADIVSDHDLVMMTFRVRMKKTKMPTQSRLRFDLEKLGNQDVTGTFQATIGGKFAPHINLRDDDIEKGSMITTYNTAVTDTASEIHRGYLLFFGEYQIYFIDCVENIRHFTSA